ncbi:hypothetical protein BIV57_18290 [Mangrovactinospora gilvigrisea]|uniref:GDT1 family protein n=1 Tax=Mangrovactinospora gilvigrisea TaxID=1428644 RepID=A0A1J7BBN6_9ACTN|nr:TMEM165/GDT1 family protein [Mangrovactinospora gilvigrisea]OIV36059.1 hypothetical protein BIV57_18290 [Mangrovactinospora gilvigrisea]
MSLSVLGITFGLVFLAELPDKTALATLMLSTRYKASWVLMGVSAAFAVHVGLALAAGSLLALLPHRWLQGIVAVMFLAGAVMLLLQKGEEDEELKKDDRKRNFGAAFGASFGLILIAEFGDLTQIMTANMAAKYNDPIAVGIGAFLALVAVASLAVTGGKALLKKVPARLITRIAAVLMLVLAGFSAYEAIAG